MNYKDVECHCLALPGAERSEPWSDTTVFKIGGKMFAVIVHAAAHKPIGLWFKAGEASYDILIQIDGIGPCPYFWRAKWVEMDGLKPLKPNELKAYLTRAHALVAAKLSRKLRKSLGISPSP
ncbi:MAG TPA: MmcQ/YjbR family DNA-binding protein [Rhizomicrobium sp.]|jgi:predicted DNA-binding protein (MmcQ/YjbR family)|nr:MmcQ/YjbR family DNA-binding protein [Rhizomicrobium sp.]